MERLNILIVDDDPSLANLIKLRIKQEASNFSIAAVESGQECLEYLKEHKVDCILSDYQMPGMSGMELLQTLRAQKNDVPFIFITGQGNENVAREAFTGGAADYFTKDWGFAHFAKIVNSVENAVRRGRIERSHMECEQALNQSEERYRSFVANCSEAIWRFELDQPIPVSLPEARQIELINKHAYLAECNDAGAHMLGLASAGDAIGMMHDVIVPPDDPRNIEHLRRFIRSGYRLANDESFVRDKKGNTRKIYSTLNGVVEKGRLVRAWGVSNAGLCPI
ncbi:MAG: response regulator [Nitrospirota bacterium]